jgi:hypothetical protein
LNSILRRRQVSQTEYSITGVSPASFIHSFTLFRSGTLFLTTLPHYHLTVLSSHYISSSSSPHGLLSASYLFCSSSVLRFIVLAAWPCSYSSPSISILHFVYSLLYSLLLPRLPSSIIQHPPPFVCLLLLAFSIPFSLAPSLHLCAPALLHSCTPAPWMSTHVPCLATVSQLSASFTHYDLPLLAPSTSVPITIPWFLLVSFGFPHKAHGLELVVNVLSFSVLWFLSLSSSDACIVQQSRLKNGLA